MKVVNFIEEDGYKIIVGFSAPTIDTEATKKNVSAFLSENPQIKDPDFPALFEEKAIFFNPGPTAELLDDNEFLQLSQIFESLQPHEKLTLDGVVVQDRRNLEYWIKKTGRWKKEKITELGQVLPAGAILELNAEQQAELNEQQEHDRLSALSPEQLEKEKQSQLDAIAEETDKLVRIRNIQGISFDPTAYYQQQAIKVMEKYEPYGL